MPKDSDPQPEDPSDPGDDLVAHVDDVTRAVLHDPPIYDAAQLATQLGISVDQARRLWRALGFADSGPTVAYGQADVEAVGVLLDSVRSGLLDFDLAVAVIRALGQTMARLADWEVGAISTRLEELDVDRGDSPTRMGTALRLVDELGGDFEKLVLYVWRRHLAAAITRIEAATARASDAHTSTVSVGFADIVSFTALSNEISSHRVGDVVELFESRCADVVTTCHGRVIKTIGDSVLFVNDDPLRAFDTAEGIISVVGRDPRMPDVRVGLATGTVVMRLGDVFGPPVNMAARLTAVARRNRIIVDHATADLLPPDQFEARPLPARPVRGFGIVEPVAVRRH